MSLEYIAYAKQVAAKLQVINPNYGHDPVTAKQAFLAGLTVEEAVTALTPIQQQYHEQSQAALAESMARLRPIVARALAA